MVIGVNDLTKCYKGIKVRERGRFMKLKNVLPDDFEFNGWSRSNNYLLVEGDFPDKRSYIKERFKRSSTVFRAYLKTDAGRAAQSAVAKRDWAERSAKAKSESDTTEVLLLEKITHHEDGFSTAELVAGCINVIARELAKRGVRDVESLELKDLILISNNLLGLTKAAAAVKKDMDWKPNTVVVPVVQSSSKTGGVVGGLKDVIDLRDEKQPGRAGL